MKNKTQLATTLIFSVMLAMAIFVGCSTERQAAKEAQEPAQTGRFEPTPPEAELSKVMECQRRCKPYSDKINFPNNWKDISAKRQEGLSGATFDHFSVVDGESGVPVPGSVAGRLFSDGHTHYGGGSTHSQLSQALMHVSADEVWVIVKPSAQAPAAGEHPGCGAMLVDLSPEQEDVPLPLKH
ncbi:MAG: hypothetical protein ABFR90_10870, partial [Planctomycetota bacterium]